MHARKRVLVVEDHHDLRQVFVTALTLAGFDTQQAADGPAALRLVEMEPPDLIVLDVLLPTLDGYSVRDEIASNARTRDIPIVIVTGATVNADRLNADRILRKPVDPLDIVATVRATLAAIAAGRHRARPNAP